MRENTFQFIYMQCGRPFQPFELSSQGSMKGGVTSQETTGKRGMQTAFKYHFYRAKMSKNELYTLYSYFPISCSLETQQCFVPCNFNKLLVVLCGLAPAKPRKMTSSLLISASGPLMSIPEVMTQSCVFQLSRSSLFASGAEQTWTRTQVTFL